MVFSFARQMRPQTERLFYFRRFFAKKNGCHDGISGPGTDVIKWNFDESFRLPADT